jgi:hypothetical protein
VEPYDLFYKKINYGVYLPTTTQRVMIQFKVNQTGRAFIKTQQVQSNKEILPNQIQVLEIPSSLESLGETEKVILSDGSVLLKVQEAHLVEMPVFPNNWNMTCNKPITVVG